jgi:hypothetical protein
VLGIPACGKGRDLRVYDAHIQMDRIYGSNRDYILDAIPHIGNDRCNGREHSVERGVPPHGSNLSTGRTRIAVAPAALGDGIKYFLPFRP